MIGYQSPAPRVGSKYAGYVDAAKVAKMVRADIKAAKTNGDLPNDIKTSVRTRKYAGGQAVDVTITGWNAEAVWAPDHTLTTAARYVQRTIETIRSAYNRNASDPMVDYYDVTYYGGTDWGVYPWEGVSS